MFPSLLSLRFLVRESLVIVEYLASARHGDRGHLRKIGLLGLSVWESRGKVF